MEILKDSFIYRCIITFVSWIENLIQNSGIYTILTKKITRRKEKGLFEEIFYNVIKILRSIFKKLKLDKIFKDSIFAKPIIWVSFTIVFSPILETMQILLFVLASIMSFILMVILEENFKFRYTPMNAWVIVFMIIYALSAVASMSIVTSLQVALLVLSFIVFYFVLVNSISTRKELDVLLTLFVGIGLLIALYGIYQYVFAGSFASSSFVDKEMFEDISTRVSGTFDNPNVMGEYLLLVIPIALTFLWNYKGWFKKTIALGSIGIMAVSLALTYSRGCYLGIAACIGIFLLLINLKFIIAFLGGLLAMPFILPASILNRFTSIGNTGDSSTSYRISIWKGAIDMVKDYWYRPIGQGTVAFNRIYPLYSYSGVGAEHTHNLFLQLIIETGILGIIAFVGMLFKFYQTLCNALKVCEDKVLKIQIIAFISGMSGFLIQSMFDNTWYNNRIILIFWTFIGLAMATRNLIPSVEKNILNKK